MSARTSYPVVCTLVGLALAWFPLLVHGPIPHKFDMFYLNGTLAVWAWYSSRMLIGLVVGISARPRNAFLRGGLCGLLIMTPPGFFALATPGCGPP